MTVLAVGLGLRSALSRHARGRFLTGAVIGAVATTCFLMAYSAVQVREREQARYEALSAIDVAGDEAAPVVARSSYRGRTVTFLLVPKGSGFMEAHGFGESPGVGEVRMSPALAGRLRDDPRLRSWFPYRRASDLPRSAVATAGEYTAAIGIDPTTFVEEPGAPGAFAGFTRPAPLHYTALGALLFVAAPGIGILAIAGRFGRRLRRERFGALRLLGLPDRHCRLAAAIETAFPIALGAVCAALVFTVFLPDHFELPVVGRWVFGADARLGLGALAAVVAGTVVGGAWAGAASGGRRTGTSRLRSFVAQADRTPVLFTVLYLLGLAACAWALLAPKPQDPLRVVGVVLVCTGLPGAVVSGAAATARLLGRRSGSVPWLLAMRKVAADPRSFARVAGMAGVVLFALGAAQPLAQLIATSDVSWERRVEESGKSTVLGRSETAPLTHLPLDPPPPEGTTIALPVVAVWAPGQRAGERPSRTGIVGSCDQLRELFAAEMSGCTGEPQALRTGQGVQDAAGVPAPGEIRDPSGRLRSTVPPVSSALVVDGVDVMPSMVVPPTLLGGEVQPFTVGVYLRVEADAEAFVAAQGWVTGASPLHRLVNEYSGFAVPGSTGGWLALGFAAAALTALVAAVLVSLDEQRTSFEWAALRALGVPGSDLLRTRAWIAAVLAIVSVVLALAPALALAFSYVRLVDDPLTSYRAYVEGAAAVAAAIAVTQFVAAATQLRALHRGPAAAP